MKSDRLVICAAFLAASSVALPSRSQTIEPLTVVAFSEDDPVILDPAKSYLLIESPMRFPPMFRFIVLPTPSQEAVWEQQRQNAVAAGAEFASDWPELAMRRIIPIGPQNRFSKSDELSVWLYEVPAGDYVFYGFGTGSYAVLSETCMCMGTVRFAVEPGFVTAVRIYGRFVDRQGNRIPLPPQGMSVVDATMHQVIVVEEPTDASLDPRVPDDRIVPAAFQPVERLSNWFGGKIARVEPIPGVFAYDRDRVIDLQATP